MIPETINLNLGSGRRSIGTDWINVDKYPHPNVNKICDLNITPYPFDDESVDSIYMFHVLEHLERPFEVMIECHRILKHGGIMEITVPHRDSLNSSDIAHRSYFTERSMCHICNTFEESDRIRNIDELDSGLQGRSNLFKILELKVERVIELPFGKQYKGFNIYHNRIGIGTRSSIYWKLMKT